jgi:hypothetical protein
MNFTRIKNENGGHQIYCVQCEKMPNDQSSLIMQPLKNRFGNVTLCAFYCQKHDGRFAYMTDDGDFDIFPLSGIDDNFYLSSTERERILVDLKDQVDFSEDALRSLENK